MDIYSLGPNWQFVTIGSDNGSVPSRRPAIFWTNDGQVCWSIYVSLDLGGLTHWGIYKCQWTWAIIGSGNGLLLIRPCHFLNQWWFVVIIERHSAMHFLRNSLKIHLEAAPSFWLSPFSWAKQIVFSQTIPHDILLFFYISMHVFIHESVLEYRPKSCSWSVQFSVKCSVFDRAKVWTSAFGDCLNKAWYHNMIWRILFKIGTGISLSPDRRQTIT